MAKQQPVTQLEKHIDKAETLLKLLANSGRLLILIQLGAGEKNVTELVKAVKLSQPAVSQHLARMRYEGLVTARKKGQAVFYKIARPEVLQLVTAVEQIFTKGEKKVEPKEKPAPAAKPEKPAKTSIAAKLKKMVDSEQLSFLK